MIRPEISALLRRYGETLVACGVIGLGVWFFLAPGPVISLFGVMVGLGGAGWAVAALRRARFQAEGEAPGVVDVIEGAVRYMGPITGGAIALSDLIAIDVLVIGGTQRNWRLRQSDGTTLSIPQAAEGAERLHDVFSALPGMRERDLTAALRHRGDAPKRVWRRSDVRDDPDAPRLPLD